jgi:hypothetical protein
MHQSLQRQQISLFFFKKWYSGQEDFQVVGLVCFQL